MAIAAYNSEIRKASGAAISFTNEATTDAGDHINYTITNAAKRYLDIDTPVVVEKSTDGGTNWNVVASNLYTLIYTGGKVIFGTAQGATHLVRLASGKYYAHSTIGGGHAYEFSGKCNLEDTTEFNTNGISTFTPTVLEGDLKFSVWFINSAHISALTARDRLITSASLPDGSRFEGYCYTSETSLKGETKGVLDQELTFHFTNQFYMH